MADAVTESTPAGYRDQRAGLIVFGILEIVIGCLCAALPVVAALVRMLVPDAFGDFDHRTMIGVAAVYLALAVLFIWLGIGSVLCRRWAGTLSLILAWCWLLSGIMTLGFFIWSAHTLPLGDETGIFLGIALGVTGIFFVLLPGAMVLFYRSRHVRATCHARDPRARWTERCPLPVLTNSIWLGLGALWLVSIPLLKQSAVPFFGYLITGATATLIYLAGGAIGSYLAYATYRLKMAGWWGTLAAFALAAISVSSTFARVDLAEFYRKSGYSEELVRQIARTPFSAGAWIAWANAACFALLVVYMLWIRKYFLKTA